VPVGGTPDDVLGRHRCSISKRLMVRHGFLDHRRALMWFDCES
jgi:hypothetical protein